MALFENYKAKYAEASETILHLKAELASKTVELAEANAKNVTLESSSNALIQQNEHLTKLLGGDSENLQSAREQILKIKRESDLLNEQLTKQRIEHETLQQAVEELKDEYIELDEQVLLQSFGFYIPQYNYSTSDEYQEKVTAMLFCSQDADLLVKIMSPIIFVPLIYQAPLGIASTSGDYRTTYGATVFNNFEDSLGKQFLKYQQEMIALHANDE